MTSTTHRTALVARLVSLLVGVVIVSAGCGDHAGSGSPSDPSSPAPSTATSPTSATTNGIPDDFPMALGLRSDGDSTVTTPRHDARGVTLQRTCWGGAWPGSAVDRLVVQQTGPELGLTRELALYPNARAAAQVGRQVRRKAGVCGQIPATRRTTAIDVTAYGDDVTGGAPVTAGFAETLPDGQPGGSVFVFTRVGRAILAVEDSGEWTRDTAGRGVRHLVRSDRALVARLCVFTGTGC
ncbi:MAG: hypothetical protein QM747_07295 [Nocardioides sp.]